MPLVLAHDMKLTQATLKAMVIERGQPTEQADAKGHIPAYRARPLVVERTHPWLNRFRRLLIPWEKKVENSLAMLHFPCAWITSRAAHLIG